MKKSPTYLRIVATTRCNNSCAYCHRDGDYHKPGTSNNLPPDILKACLRVAAISGIKKFKFVGGEPFLRSDLPDLIHHIREIGPENDISIITAGVVPIDKLDAVWAAGLSRVNISLHGFTPAAFSLRNRSSKAYKLRSKFIEKVVSERKAPVKINYVYSSKSDRDDLAALLKWAAMHSLLVNVLDNLSGDCDWHTITKIIREIHGSPENIIEAQDPYSLPTLHWYYSDGLKVEIKNRKLGEFAPFYSCIDCFQKIKCKEGIYALRLTHRGQLQPCMDRPDLNLPLAHIINSKGESEAIKMWDKYLKHL